MRLRQEARELMVRCALHDLNQPYMWGGDDPFSGQDCSDLVKLWFQEFGMLRSGDWNAEALRRIWQPVCEVPKPYMGCPVFYLAGDPPRAVHVMLCLNEEFCIGAQGGSSKMKRDYQAKIAAAPRWFPKHLLAREVAQEHNAFVQIRRIDHRGIPQNRVFVDPFSLNKTMP